MVRDGIGGYMQTILVDMTAGFRMPTIYYSQGDVGTQFAIDLYSRFGDSLPSSPTVTIEATKPSGLGYTVAATSVSGSKVIFTNTEIMTDEAGRFQAELKVISGSVTLFTANFYMQGEAKAHPDGTIDGQKGSILPQLTQLVNEVVAAADSIHDLSVNAVTLAYDAEATATYDETTNTITFGIPRGGELVASDPNSDGNIVITFQ